MLQRAGGRRRRVRPSALRAVRVDAAADERERERVAIDCRQRGTQGRLPVSMDSTLLSVVFKRNHDALMYTRYYCENNIRKLALHDFG